MEFNSNQKKDSVTSCLELVDSIFNCKSANTEDTKAFRDLSHEALCQSFQYWLEKMRTTIPEPINIAITQSLRDEGIDVLLEFSKSQVKIGFQIKSCFDVDQKEFTHSCIAQISRSHKHSISRLIMAIGADLTNESQKQKVRGLTSEISQIGDFCKVFSPEKTLTIWRTFDKKEHPIGQTEGLGDAMNLIQALQKKLSSDQYYKHNISWKSTLKEKHNPKDQKGELEFKVVVKQPPDSKNVMDALKEISLTGDSFTIPAENIEKLQIRKNGKIIDNNKKIPYVTITPEKRKIALTLETVDPVNGSPLRFENLLFFIDSVVGKAIHLSTHESNIPYHFRFCMENERFVGNIGATVDNSASAMQRYKLVKFVDALSAGSSISLKDSNGNIVLLGKPRNQPAVISKDTIEILKQLSYIQEKTGEEICPPNTLTPKDLEDIIFAYTLLSTGSARINSIEFSSKFNKMQADDFLQIFRAENALKNCTLNKMQVEIDLFGKKIPLGPGLYQIPTMVLSDGLIEVERQISQLGAVDEIVIKFRNLPDGAAIVKLAAN